VLTLGVYLPVALLLGSSPPEPKIRSRERRRAQALPDARPPISAQTSYYEQARGSGSSGIAAYRLAARLASVVRERF
jgi:hypothetical protein